MLYRKEFGVTPVEVDGNHALLSLDIAAALSEDKQILTIGIVNPNREAKEVRLTIAGARAQEVGTVSFVRGDAPDVVNDEDNMRVKIETKAAKYDGTLTAPALSISLYRFPVR